MFLARTVTHSTLAELRQRMTRWEFNHWMALYAAEPWGEVRADWAAGQIAAVTATAHSSKRIYRPSDFMPDFERQYRSPQTQDEMMAAAMKATRLFGGEVK